MPSSSLPMGGIVYHYQGYSNSVNHPLFQNPPGPPPGSPANLQVQAETDLTMVSLTEMVMAKISKLTP